MDADVNNSSKSMNNKTSVNHSTPILIPDKLMASSSSSAYSNLTSTHVENMDTTNWPPLEEHLHNLHTRGVSMQLSNNALLQQQQHIAQPLEQRTQTKNQQFLQQQQQRSGHKQLSQNSKVKVQVQSMHKTKGNNKKSKKLSNKRKKSANNSSTDSLSNISEQNLTHTPTHSNRFALLSDLNISSMDMHNLQSANNSNMHGMQNASQHTTRNQPRHSQTSTNDVANRGNIQTAKFCPPIILYNIDISNLVSQFKLSFPEVEIKIINSSKNKSKLYVKDIHAYTTLMGILKDRKISSHSFTPIENRQVAIILRGLHRNTLPIDIKAELESIIPNTISDVKIFTTPHMKKHAITSDLFLVTLIPGKLYNDIINIK